MSSRGCRSSLLGFLSLKNIGTVLEKETVYYKQTETDPTLYAPRPTQCLYLPLDSLRLARTITVGKVAAISKMSTQGEGRRRKGEREGGRARRNEYAHKKV